MPAELENERHLVERCQQGDLSVYEDIYRHFSQPLLRVALHMLGRREDAEDAVQTTFIKLYRGIGNFRFDARFSTYLIRIAINVCHDALDKRKRQKMQVPYIPETTQRPQSDLRLQLEEAIRALPERMRECFVLFAIEEYKQAEMDRENRSLVRLFRRHSSSIYKAAAVLAIGIGIGSYIAAPTTTTQLRLFSQSTLEQVEETERQYIAAIAALEGTAAARMARMDLSLMLLYRDKLETIDAQIAYCKEALHNNPANAHIRRYLLIALQDKKKALQEIIDNPAMAKTTDS